MWKVKHLEALSTFKIETDHEPPVELRTNDVNAHAEAVVNKIALIPEMEAMLREIANHLSIFHPKSSRLNDLIEKIDAAIGETTTGGRDDETLA